MSLFPLRKQTIEDHRKTELRLTAAERIAQNHAARLRRLEAEVELIKRFQRGREPAT